MNNCKRVLARSELLCVPFFSRTSLGMIASLILTGAFVVLQMKENQSEKKIGVAIL